MKHYLAMLVTSTAIAFSSLVYAADETAQGQSKVDYKDNGGYDASRSSQNTDANGTVTKSEEKASVDVDSKGLETRKLSTSDSTDPKGLMNKKTDNTNTKYTEKANGGYKQVTTTTHTDANGTNVKLVTTTNVDIDNKGNVTSTVKTKKVVDPKGLMNEKTSTSMTKTVNGKVVEEKKDGNY